MRSPRLVGALALLCAAALSACSDSPVELEPGPYASDFEAALEFATSDFEREALADGEITRAEYVEAHQLWLACMEEQFPPGSSYVAGLRERDDGLFEFVLTSPAGVDSGDRAAEFDQFNAECAQGTIDLVGSLYNDITRNPNNSSVTELLFACLESGGLIPAGYTLADLEDDWYARTHGEQQGPNSVLTDPLDPEVAACIHQ